MYLAKTRDVELPMLSAILASNRVHLEHALQKVLDTLQSLQVLEASSSGDFALLYSDMQFSAHKEAVALFMTFEKGGDNATVQGFAARTLPTLAMHLMHVKAMVEKSST